ncbi:MAG: P-loop NTPase [Deltaproteobacteria bacterium]|nr:P-loop NTPase [Deltaproteobacteria bacterium]
MVPAMTQRHPAVKRLPHEEVSVEARTVEATFPDPLLVMQHDPDSPQAAAYRVLGHRVTRPAGMRALMVTSAEGCDGKTTCAINLAMALSEGGRATVLLVEANLRRPGIARALGFEPPLCFEAQLTAHKEQPMSPWTIARVTQWMHVVAVNPITLTGAKMIDALGVELAIEHFKRLPYDFIVVDTPAVLGQADVTLMHDCVDGVLLTGIAGESDGIAIREATQLLAPSNILGLALLEG